MVYLGRGVADRVDVFQDETLTISCPIAAQACLNEVSGGALANKLFTTHRGVPLLNVVDSMNSGVKAPHDDEGFDPKEQARREELVDGIAHFLDVVATAGSPCEVLRPEFARVSQRIPDLCLGAGGEVFNFAEGDIVVQVANILLQSTLHQVETREQNLSMVDRWIYKESSILASSRVHNKVRERSMQNPDRVTPAVRDKEERTE